MGRKQTTETTENALRTPNKPPSHPTSHTASKNANAVAPMLSNATALEIGFGLGYGFETAVWSPRFFAPPVTSKAPFHPSWCFL